MIVSLGLFRFVGFFGLNLAPKGVAIELVPHFDCNAVTDPKTPKHLVFCMGKQRGQDKYDFQFAVIAFTRFAFRLPNDWLTDH